MLDCPEWPISAIFHLTPMGPQCVHQADIEKLLSRLRKTRPSEGTRDIHFQPAALSLTSAQAPLKGLCTLVAIGGGMSHRQRCGRYRRAIVRTSVSPYKLELLEALCQGTHNRRSNHSPPPPAANMLQLGAKQQSCWVTLLLRFRPKPRLTPEKPRVTLL